ncbi:hypothetical protein OF83DRAFT_1168769 [Amylostereum chailletii]|nr:hypothetical protein OF83DRAFT_1168769 [Amylostereum chailletii]
MDSGLSPHQYWQNAARPRLQGVVDVQPLSNADAVAGARTTIDNELEAIRILLSTVMVHRNSLALTSSLPVELLARVFEFHAIAQPPGLSHFNTVPSNALGWITVSHVCRFWRQVALNHPGLWERIAFDLGPSWTLRMLDRAKAYPIIFKRTVDFRTSSSTDQSLITHHMYHIKELNFHAPPHIMDPIILSLKSPAPALQTLSLVATYPLVRRVRETSPPSLPSSFLSRNAPQLRRITLHGCFFPWQAVPTNGCQITSLDLTFPGRDATGLVEHEAAACPTPDTHTLDRVLDSLDRMPLLESLALHDCLPVQVGTVGNRLPIVSLPRLVKLGLSGAAQSCLNLLQSLRIPPLAKIALNCSSPDIADVNDFFAVLTWVAAYLSSPSRTPLHILDFTSASIPPDVKATAWSQRPASESYPDCAFVPPPDPDLVLHFQSPRHPSTLSSIAEAMCRAIPLANLQRFSIGFLDSEWTANTWVEMFSVATGVTTVETHGSASMEFCKALAPTTGSRGRVGRRKRRTYRNDAILPLFLPKLERLSLIEVDFCVDTSDNPNGSNCFYKCLPVWLQRRKDAGAALKELDIQYCTVEHIWIGELEKVVPRVTWDGQRGDLESADDYDNYDEDDRYSHSDDYDAYY